MSAAKTVKKKGKSGKAAATRGRAAAARGGSNGAAGGRKSAGARASSSGARAKSPAAYKEPGLLQRLAKGPVICAEGYVFELERRGYDDTEFVMLRLATAP